MIESISTTFTVSAFVNVLRVREERESDVPVLAEARPVRLLRVVRVRLPLLVLPVVLLLLVDLLLLLLLMVPVLLLLRLFLIVPTRLLDDELILVPDLLLSLLLIVPIRAPALLERVLASTDCPVLPALLNPVL
jgi:hypothetical protein